MYETPIDQYLQTRQVYNPSRAFSDVRTGGITKDVAFNRLSFDGGEIKSPKDNARVVVGDDEIEVKLVQGIDEAAFRRTLGMAQMATQGVDLDTWEEGMTDWEEMLKGGLQTALETQVIVFAVSGVSRAETHQAVRSRRAAFHQQSMRAHWYGSQPETRIPESVWANAKAREAFLKAMEAAHSAYRIACAEDISYQDARYILPEGTTNFIMHEYPVREFLNVYAYRACSMFQWEIVSVMRKMREVLIEAHPWIEPYVKISCEKTHGALDDEDRLHDGPNADAHACTFQGWEEVEGQCDFPWARETNRTFKSERHSIKRGSPPRQDESAATHVKRILRDDAVKRGRVNEESEQEARREAYKAHERIREIEDRVIKGHEGEEDTPQLRAQIEAEVRHQIYLEDKLGGPIALDLTMPDGKSLKEVMEEATFEQIRKGKIVFGLHGEVEISLPYITYRPGEEILVEIVKESPQAEVLPFDRPERQEEIREAVKAVWENRESALPHGARLSVIPPSLKPLTHPGPNCPTCDSPNPSFHPAVQEGGEVQPCSDPFHPPLKESEGVKGGPIGEVGLDQQLEERDRRREEAERRKREEELAGRDADQERAMKRARRGIHAVPDEEHGGSTNDAS